MPASPVRQCIRLSQLAPCSAEIRCIQVLTVNKKKLDKVSRLQRVTTSFTNNKNRYAMLETNTLIARNRLSRSTAIKKHFSIDSHVPKTFSVEIIAD